jgi:hypothetical protein
MIDCCKSPDLTALSWQVDYCYDDLCKNNTDECCAFICLFKLLGFAQFPEDRNEPAVLDPEGLVYSFMLSVDNDTSWEPVIRNSVKRCWNDNYGVSTDLYCNFPLDLWTGIGNCAFWENFLRCPIYNPNGITECEATRQYITECELGG